MDQSAYEGQRKNDKAMVFTCFQKTGLGDFTRKWHDYTLAK
jgi:hypothetical protein